MTVEALTSISKLGSLCIGISAQDSSYTWRNVDDTAIFIANESPRFVLQDAIDFQANMLSRWI
jgi:hypothetical protein